MCKNFVLKTHSHPLLGPLLEIGWVGAQIQVYKQKLCGATPLGETTVLGWLCPWLFKLSYPAIPQQHGCLPTQSGPSPPSRSGLGSLVAQRVKRLPAMRETWVRSLGWEDALEKEMATHSSTLAWKILWTEEPGGLQFLGSQRVGHNWATSVFHFQPLGQTLVNCISSLWLLQYIVSLSCHCPWAGSAMLRASSTSQILGSEMEDPRPHNTLHKYICWMTG